VLEEVAYLNTGSIGLEPLPVQHAAEELGSQIAGRGTVGFDDEVEKRVARCNPGDRYEVSQLVAALRATR